MMILIVPDKQIQAIRKRRCDPVRVGSGVLGFEYERTGLMKG